MAQQARNEIGNVYGHLTVISKAYKKYGRNFYLCKCDCGNETTVDIGHLRSGHTTSCGCRKNVRHGGSKTPEYVVWCDMLSRCNNPNNIAYKNYGGRGIKVCERWAKFPNFIADMGSRPSSKHTIDRMNNDGDYEPSNCRWATRKEQQNNMRSNHYLELNGEKKTISRWSEDLGIKLTTLIGRLDRGWTVEETLTTPLHTQLHHK